MNPYKLRSILEAIRGRGSLPRDQLGDVLCTDDLLVWFDLADQLSFEEQRIVKNELSLIAEAEAFMDQLRPGMS